MKTKLIGPKLGDLSALAKSDLNLIDELLKFRGVKDCKGFCNPSRSNLGRWQDLDNIMVGINLISTVLSGEKKVALVQDCDVDGITSAAIMYDTLVKLNPEIEIDVCIHSGKQHGMEDLWEKLADKQWDLIIVPDAGTNDGEYFKAIGAKVLVIDHHLLEEGSNTDVEDVVIINNQLSPNYANKGLSGSGMVYQFCRGMEEVLDLKDYDADYYMDLAAFGICSDVMSALELENQYIWSIGFSKLNNYFLKTILRKQAYSIAGNKDATDEELYDHLSPTAASFYIIPMINAMIRVGSMEEKERLFHAFVDGKEMIDSHKRGEKGLKTEAATESARECTNARNKQNRIKEKAVEKIEFQIAKNDLLANKVLLIRLEETDDFPPTLNGLVAMELSKKYKRPTIVARVNDQGFIRGSARGVDNTELDSFKDFINSSNMFEYTGGHDNAFGLSLADKKLDSFHIYANDTLGEMDFDEGCFDVDFKFNGEDTEDIIELVYEAYELRNQWGAKNSEPIVSVDGIKVKKGDFFIMGTKKDTVKFTHNGLIYIKFKAADLIKDLEKFSDTTSISMSVVGKGNMNEYRGMKTPQIFVKDYEMEDDFLSF